ncbi:MAG: hypothetical protein MZW92_31375 [Comamonadaceae bacterium]|nr:hypothetical protein [Comamonadaceae bacterium]
MEEMRTVYKEKEAAAETAQLPSITVGSSISLPMLAQIESHSNAQIAALRSCSQLVLTQDAALRLSEEKERALLEALQTHEGLKANQEARIKNLGKQLAGETRAKTWWRGGAFVAAGAALVSVLKR